MEKAPNYLFCMLYCRYFHSDTLLIECFAFMVTHLPQCQLICQSVLFSGTLNPHSAI